METAPCIEITEDGSATLRSPICGDTYHSMRGAVGESRHVFIGNGFLRMGCDPVRILEVGFGTGLNAWLTLLEAAKQGREVEYTAVELYPISEEVAASLHYSSDPHFLTMHRAEWNAEARITDHFTLRKMQADLTEANFSDTFDLVYHDAFAPDTQPEMWTPEIFSKIHGTMTEGGVLVTYSAKGDVKRALRTVGFEVERLPGALGKRHMLRGTKS